jgi:hypothetical protein
MWINLKETWECWIFVPIKPLKFAECCIKLLVRGLF